MDKRLMILLQNRGGQIKDGCMIDTYNQQIQYDISCTIRTNINTANHHFIVEQCNTKVKKYTPTKVSIGTQPKSSFEDSWGGISRCVKTDDSLAVIEEKIIKVGNYSPSGHNASTIVDGNGISPTVMENHGTITAVIEPQVINPLKGQTDNGWHYEQQVYDECGITRAVKAGGGSGNIPKVIEPQVLMPKRTEFGKAIRKQYESHEIEMSRHDMTTMEPRTDGIANTLTSVQKDNYLAIPEATTKGYAEAHEGDSVNLAVPNSKTRRGRVGKQVAQTLDTGCQQGVVEAEEEQPQVKYRIRKLTPREVFRLQGVDDADIDKLLNAGISNSQLYKCAGNSITVDVLYHIFRKAYIDKGCETIQPTLF